MAPDRKKSRPKVSVIVLNYNGKHLLKDCFESLKKTKYPNFEAVMVDNASTDGSVDYVRKNFKYVKIIEAGTNAGFAAGNNLGIRKTKGKYVFLLNNDTICTEDWLSRLVDVAESDPTIGVCGAFPPNTKYMGTKLDPPWPRLVEASTVSGAAMLIRRDILKETGLLDDRYFLYWEETDFCWKANLYGHKVVMLYDAIIYHKVTSTGIPGRWVYEATKNKLCTHIKLMPWGYALKILFAEIFISIARITRDPKEFLSPLKAWLWNLKHLPEILAERRKIMSKKRISTSKLVALVMSDKRRRKRDQTFLEKASGEQQ